MTADLTDSGSYCIWIAADNITVNLNGHEITGTGSDECIAVEDQSSSSPSAGSPSRSVQDDTVNGGGGQLNGCGYGLYVYYGTRTAAGDLTIYKPVTAGIEEEYSVNSAFSRFDVADGNSTASGFYGYGGSRTRVTDSSVTATGKPTSFEAEYEYGDSFSGDRATYSSGPGGKGTGFYDLYSNRDSYVGDRAYDQLIGFDLYEDSYGTVYAANNLARNLGEHASASYGFYDYYSYDDTDYGPQNHTTIAHNNVIGYYDGYYDYYNISETSVDNESQAANHYGFWFDYPADYTIHGDTSDGTYDGKAYGKKAAYGFFFEETYSYYALRNFYSNTSENNYYGFYSWKAEDGFGIHGYGNEAIHDTNDSYGVEVS